MHKKKGTYIQRTPPPVPLAITPTFRPCTHTSDDSYMYQLSLVVATAAVSFIVIVDTYQESFMAYGQVPHQHFRSRVVTQEVVRELLANLSVAVILVVRE